MKSLKKTLLFYMQSTRLDPVSGNSESEQAAYFKLEPPLQKIASSILSFLFFKCLFMQCKQVILCSQECWVPASNSQHFVLGRKSPKRLWLSSSCVSELEVEDDRSNTSCVWNTCTGSNTRCVCNTCTGRGVFHFPSVLQCNLLAPSPLC